MEGSLGLYGSIRHLHLRQQTHERKRTQLCTPSDVECAAAQGHASAYGKIGVPLQQRAVHGELLRDGHACVNAVPMYALVVLVTIRHYECSDGSSSQQ